MMKTHLKPLVSLILLAISSPAAIAAGAHEAMDMQDDSVMIVTSPASSPLEVVTSPKTPRQPVPASDGSDYLKTIPGFSQIRNGGTNGDPVFRGMF
jgi:iron complex outermembrane receptor protein